LTLYVVLVDSKSIKILMIKCPINSNYKQFELKTEASNKSYLLLIPLKGAHVA